MKIKVIHAVCGREILVQQILETGGHCPWDGKPFNRDYTAVLAEALGAAENAGSVLENALEKVAGTNPAMTFDRQSILREIEAQIDRLDSRREAGRR